MLLKSETLTLILFSAVHSDVGDLVIHFLELNLEKSVSQTGSSGNRMEGSGTTLFNSDDGRDRIYVERRLTSKTGSDRSLHHLITPDRTSMPIWAAMCLWRAASREVVSQLRARYRARRSGTDTCRLHRASRPALPYQQMLRRERNHDPTVLTAQRISHVFSFSDSCAFHHAVGAMSPVQVHHHRLLALTCMSVVSPVESTALTCVELSWDLAWLVRWTQWTSVQVRPGTRALKN